MMQNVIKIIRILLVYVCMTAIWSCGDSESFTIEGTVDGNVTLNLRFIYQTGNGLARGITAARDGKFEFKGSSSVPTIVEILDNDYRPLGRVYTVNGDRIECQLVRNSPYKISVKGNETSERWARFVNANAERLSSDDSNTTIEEYVSSHPDDIVSTLLMLTSYDASSNALRADSIMASIDPSVRPGALTDGFNYLLQRIVTSRSGEAITAIDGFNMNDSLATFLPSDRPMSLIAVGQHKGGDKDSVSAALRRLNRRELRSKLQICDISTDRDTESWRRSARADSADWTKLWVFGSIASPGLEELGIPKLPYFIVTDSAGTQLLRTPSISRAEAYVDSCLTEKKN